MTIQLFSDGCPVCERHTKTEKHCELDGHEYVRCLECGLVYQSGETTSAKIQACYEGSKLKSLRRKLLNRFRKVENQRDFSQRMERANEIFSFSSSKSNLDKGAYLDIGCNKGFNLYAADESGWTAYGNELVNEILVPTFNSKPHLKQRVFIGGFLEMSAKYEDGSFDVITCIDIIEHLTDPKVAMLEIKRILKPGGVAIFQTPEASPENIDMKENWGALKANEHLLLFNESNFKQFSENAGFSGVEFSPKPFEECDGNFVAVCRK